MLMRPWLLVGLVLLVPVLIAFLYRSRVSMATVPSTLLFAAIARSRLKNRAFRDLVRRLSFLACLAGVGALVLAAAEPRGFGESRSIALVVDVSASMGGDTEEELREQVARLIRQSTGRDRITIIAAGRAPRHIVGPTRDPSELVSALDALEIESGEADLMAALELGDSLVDGARRPRVWLLTDGGASSIERDVELRSPLRVLRVGERRDNVGITVFAARPPVDAADDDEREALVTVVASPGPSRRVTVTLEADGVELEEREITLTGGTETQIDFRVRVGAERLTARVSPSSEGGTGFVDGLASDDEATLSLVRSTALIAHLIADEEDGAAWFVERALRASGVAEVIRHSPAGAPVRLEDGAVAVVVGAAPEHRIIGPTLFLDSRTGDLPVRVSSPLNGAATQLRSIDADHVLTRGVDLDGATIAGATAVDPGPDDQSVIELDGGTVLAIGGAGRGRWIYLGIDPLGSDVVLRVAFPVLIANALSTLSGSTDVRVAQTLPARESSLTASETLADAAALADTLPLPASLPTLLAAAAALLLFSEGGAFALGYAR